MQSYRLEDALKLQAFYRANKGRRFHRDEICKVLDNQSYTERHTEIRRDFSCTCGENKKTCTALEHIQSLGKGEFWYICKKISYGNGFKPSQTVMRIEQLPERTQPLQGEILTKWEATRQMLQRRSNV